MSFAELKDQVARLGAEERLDLAALIAHLSRADDPQYQEELDRRSEAMDGGRKTGQAKLKQVHDQLSGKGE